MSKLEELIQKYCPDGVKWSTIGDVCQKVFAGGTPTSSNSSYYGGDIPWLRSGEVNFNEITSTEKTITEEGYNSSSARWVESRSVLVAMTGATVARSAITLIELTANQSVCALTPKRDILNYRYLFYWISKSYIQMKGMAQGALTSLNLNLIKSLEIPIPPLPVQEEIVRILDTFTELQAELQAELQKRLQQYNYYRDNLLSFEGRGDVTFVPLNSIANLYRGKVISKDYIRDNEGDFPVYSSQSANDGVMGRISTYMYEGNYLTWTTDGAYAGTVFRRSGKFNITNVCGLVKVINKNVNLDFLFYWLKAEAPKYVYSGMGNPKLMSNVMSTISVPMLPLSEQEKIASILDRFDTLTCDLVAGLPAEIEKRKQQYEYYRDKLLTFKRITK